MTLSSLNPIRSCSRRSGPGAHQLMRPVIRMKAGTKLTATDHANVTFEVDGIDERTRSGWSVLIRGLAEEVTEAHGIDLVERTTATGVEPWAPGEHGHWLRLIPHAITGRQIVPGELPSIFDAGAYL